MGVTSASAVVVFVITAKEDLAIIVVAVIVTPLTTITVVPVAPVAVAVLAVLAVSRAGAGLGMTATALAVWISSVFEEGG